MMLERSRVVSLNLPPSASTDAQIVRSLKFVNDGLTKVQDQASRSGGSSETETALRELGESYDRLIGMMEQDDIGKAKVKDLKRSIPE